MTPTQVHVHHSPHARSIVIVPKDRLVRQHPSVSESVNKSPHLSTAVIKQDVLPAQHVLTKTTQEGHVPPHVPLHVIATQAKIA